MNSSLKGVAIAAAAMVAVGLTLTGIGYGAGGNQSIYFDSTGIHVGNENKHDEKTETLSQELKSFSSIHTDLDFYDVDLIPSDKYAIEAVYDSKYGKPDFRIENDTLIVEAKNKKFHVNIDIFDFTSRNNMSVKIYYPKTAKLKDIVIKGGSSDMSFENLTAEKAEFDVDLGRLELTNISAKNVKVEMDSGDCMMSKITADDLNVVNDLGKTTLESAKLKTLEVKADSGDIKLSDVTADYGKLNLDLGRLSAEKLATNGLKVVNGSGDIDLKGTLLGTTDITCDLGKVTLEPGAAKDQFNYELNADMGKVTIGGDSVSGNISSVNGAKNTLKVKADSGDIQVNFNK